MIRNKAKEKIRRGDIAFGSEIMFPSPDVAEILGYAGMDFVYLDMEHSATTLESLVHMVRAAEIGGATPLVRIPETLPGNYAGTILPLLDLGAMGVIVPHIESGTQARAVVEAVKYHPLGRRGMFDVGRQSGYGFTMSGPDYVRQANEETLIVLMIESREGVEQLEDILRVEGVDTILIGTSDLSQSLGCPGQLTAAPVLEAIERIQKACRAGGVACGVGSFASYPPELTSRFMANGVGFININANNIISAGVRHWRDWLARTDGLRVKPATTK